MPVDRRAILHRLHSPAGLLLLALAAMLVLAFLPARWTDPIRNGLATALRPGQRMAAAARRWAHGARTRLQGHFQSAARLAELEEEARQLQQDNQRLAAELAAAQGQTAREAPGDATDRLLQAQCVTAQILGRQARAFLVRQHLLDAGALAGAQPEALVLDRPPIVDQGEDARLQPGHLALSGRRVWGKIVQLGPYTSTVRTVTEPGYRDLVQVGLSPDCRGLIEGTGERLARVRQVEVTEPVAIGDPVYAAAAKGLLPVSLLYGRIARLERPVGAAHWDIWVEPAVTGEPQEVWVLRTELNPLRVAKKEESGRQTVGGSK